MKLEDKRKILLVCPMIDNQSGIFISNELVWMEENRVAYFDWRQLAYESGLDQMNIELLEVIKELKPDLTLIIKGIGITGETIRKMKEIHPHHIVGWIFDVTLSGIYVKDVKPYINMLKELDVFYTIDNSAVPELKELGVNCKYLGQGSHNDVFKEQVFNSVQKKKYGADVVFIGTLGSIHPNRIKMLERIFAEGFKFKIYGNVSFEKGQEPLFIKDCHTGFAAIDDMHSIVCGSSKIVIGLDGWPDRSKAWSFRIYKVLNAGAFYLTTYTKDIETLFKSGKHLETYKDGDELIEKIVKYLNDDEAREKIAKAGQKECLKNHTLKQRLQVILGDMKEMQK